VKLATTALGVDRDQDAGIAAVLGVEGGSLHLELADCVERDLRVLAVVGAHVRVDGSIEEHIIHGAAEAVHLKGVGVVEGEAEARAVVRNDAGQRAHERLEVAAIQTKLGDLACIDDEALVGGRSFDHRNGCVNGNGFGGCPNLVVEFAEIHDLVLIKRRPDRSTVRNPAASDFTV
jgi:hypothetical protein